MPEHWTDKNLDNDGLFKDDPNAFRTYTGLKINPWNITNKDIRLEDIAWSLSNICRYNGHVTKFLSVAEHSVEVASRLTKESLDVQIAGLFHDAAEAYTGDIIRPIKRHASFDALQALEDKCNRAIAVWLNIPAHLFYTLVIKEADMAAYLEEERSNRTGLHTPDQAFRVFIDYYKHLLRQ